MRGGGTRGAVYNKSHSGTSRHIPGYSDIFRTMAFSVLEAHSEPYQTSTIESIAKIANVYNYFRNISFSRSLLHEISWIF